ncbi:efflux RND transporter periplasmic adaptor subunit [Fluviibacterium sp. S390]|uniref:efflux RND transporter periplasmic adaptor subunit n=1 Tax=Fluviibacterium sp. S390 TaxID=3415139 RepID=UPI003C7E6467
MLFLRRALTGVLLFALTFGALGWAGTSVYRAVQAMLAEEDRQRPAREVVLAVNVVTVTPERVVPVMDVFGEIRSHRILEVRATSTGKLVELSPDFRDGGEVAEGDQLALIDPAKAKADLALARADLAEAEADLRDSRRALELAQDELGVAIEQADLRAQALSRQNDLSDRGVGSVSAVETAALAAAQARQSVVSRRQAVATAETRIEQAAAKRDRSRIAMEEAQRLLDEKSIRAKFTGTLSDVTVVEGGLVSANERMARLVDPSALEVAFRLSTAQYARLLDDSGGLRRAPIEVRMDVAGLNLRAEGAIERVSAEVGEGQSGREVFARLSTSVGFRPGDIVTVQIREAPIGGVARLPARALGSDGAVLVVGDDDRLQAHQVELIRRQGDTVLVRAPDLVGAEVVAQRIPSLGTGLKVRPIRPEGTEAPEPEPMVTLTPEHRARLIAAVQGNNRMPAEARDRVLSILAQDEVPARVVERIEERMGG